MCQGFTIHGIEMDCIYRGAAYTQRFAAVIYGANEKAKEASCYVEA